MLIYQHLFQHNGLRTRMSWHYHRCMNAGVFFVKWTFFSKDFILWLKEVLVLEHYSWCLLKHKILNVLRNRIVLGNLVKLLLIGFYQVSFILYRYTDLLWWREPLPFYDFHIKLIWNLCFWLKSNSFNAIVYMLGTDWDHFTCEKPDRKGSSTAELIVKWLWVGRLKKADNVL